MLGRCALAACLSITWTVSAQEPCITDATRQRASCPTVPAASLVKVRANRSGTTSERSRRATLELRDALATHTVDAEPSALEQAASSYRHILDTHADLDALDLSGLPDSISAPTRDGVRTYLAEAQWKLQRWTECAQTLDALAADVALDSDAAYLRVLCHHSAYVERRAVEFGRRGEGEGSRRGRRRAAEPEPLQPRAFTALDRGLIDAFQRYLCAHPGAGDGVAVQYRLARFYYEANHDQDAALRFEQIAREHPDHELGIFAANLWLDALNLMATRLEPPRPVCRTDLENAIEPLQAGYCAEPAQRERNESLCPVLDRLECQVGRRRAERFGREGEHARAAATYIQLAEECEPGDELLYDAAVHLESGHLLERAIAVRSRLIETYPDSVLSMRAMWQVARNHHTVGRYEDAAASYAAFARRYPGEDGGGCARQEDCPDAVRALRTAIELTMGIGSPREVRQLVELFARNYARRRPAELMAIEWSLARWYEQHDLLSRAREQVERMLRAHRQLSPGQILEAHVMLGRLESRRSIAEQHLRRAVDLAASMALNDPESSHPGARAAAAEAFHRLAELARAEWRARRSSRPTESQIAARVDGMQAVEAQYEAVARYESAPWLIASARRVGEMHLTLADELPPGERATQLRQSARDKLAFCFVTGVRMRVFDEHTRACAERLSALDPDAYPTPEELVGSRLRPVDRPHPGPVDGDDARAR